MVHDIEAAARDLRTRMPPTRGEWLLFTVAVLWTLFVLLLLRGALDTQDLLTAIAFPWGLVLAAYIARRSRAFAEARKQFWREFSEDQGWTYEPAGDLTDERAVMLQ